MTDSLLTNAIFGLCAALVLWYFLGRELNRQRGMRVVQAIRAGLPHLGEQANYRLRPGSGLELSVLKPRVPYKKVSIHVVLEARDILLLWPINHYLRGKRDQLVIHCELLSQPTRELLLADSDTQLGRLALEKARAAGRVAKPLTGTARSGVNFQRWAKGKAEERLISDFARAGIKPDLPLWVLRTQKSSPQLLLICGIERIDPDQMKQLLWLLHKLALDVVKGELLNRIRARDRDQKVVEGANPLPQEEPPPEDAPPTA